MTQESSQHRFPLFTDRILTDRRTFLKTAAASAGGAFSIDWATGQGLSRLELENEASTIERRWFEKTWRRAVIDMHIPDWDPDFLSKIDPDKYVKASIRSRAQSIVLYAQSHVGLFNYPTKIGKQHANLRGRDLVAELIERCHAHGIAVVLYVSVIHDRWAADQNPDWRIIHPNRGEFGRGSRHGFVCPNSPYREYVRAWASEIAQRYHFEGIRFDMTFWVCVCSCRHCQKRWEEEVGGTLPTKVDWTDPKWVQFQRRREVWLGEFASICTGTVKRYQPTATVEHQSSIYPGSWNNGGSWPLVAQNDFLQGDFYGDALQGSFVRKMLENLTPNRPFGYETSFSVSLQDHTARKSEALLETKAYAAIADGAAFIFIDAMDPIGTVSRRAHERMGDVFDRLMPYYQHLGGDRIMDVGVYFSLESRFDPRQNGRNVIEVDNGADSHTPAAIKAAGRLITKHRPFGVITKRALGSKLQSLKTLVLSNVHHMDEEEVEMIRQWVRQGGTLYASGTTSLVNTRGELQPDFMLGDVLGISAVEINWSDYDHYICPTQAGQPFFTEWTSNYPAFTPGPGMRIRVRDQANVLATTTLPWPASRPRQFSGIHSNPPWVRTARPEVVLNDFGRGRAIYSATVIEQHDHLADSFAALLFHLHENLTFEVETHPAVEATLFHQKDQSRYMLSLINFQKDLPNIPIRHIPVTLRLPQKIHRIRSIPELGDILFQDLDSSITFTIPELGTLKMIEIQYA